MKYYDLDISITTKMGDHYETRAQSKTMGESHGRLSFADVEQIRGTFKNLPIRGINESTLKEVGNSLFTALFSGEIGTLYQRALGQVYADDNAGVRIRLTIDPPDLAALPWEHLYDEGRNCFLATSSETPLTRYIEVAKPIKDLQTSLPIRILILIPGGSGLDVELEKRTILESLAGLEDAVEVTVLDGKVTSDSLSRELVLRQFHILHFIGHGAFENEKGCLLLNSDDDREHDLVSAREFSFNFQDYPSMKLVVLNSCSGAASSTQSLTGVAQELVSTGVPAVIAMREEITDKAAKLFAKDFYLKLCLGYERGRVDIAISHARKRLLAEMDKTREFANPVLFMRSPTGVIFDLSEGQAITTVRELHTNNAVTRTLDHNIAQIEKLGGEGAAAEVAKETQAKSQVRARVVDFYKRIAIAAAPRVIAMALLLAVVVFFASHTRILNVFRVDDYLAATLRLWSGAPDRPLDPNVRLIVADQNDERELGNFGIGWRDHHTALVGGLSELNEKPSVIAIDLEFNEPAGQDTQFAEAITKARSNGVQIVGGKRVEDDGETNPDSEFSAKLRPAFGDSWGDVHVGGVMPLSLLLGNGLYVNEYEIASLPKGADLGTDVVVVPSLAVKAIMQHYYDAAFQPQAFYNEAAGEVIIKAVDAGKPIEKRIPVSRTDLRLNMILEYASKSALEDNTKQYRNVYRWATSKTEEDRTYLQDMFKNKIILIGFDTDKDRHSTIGDGQRTGVEFHANAISNILKGDYIREVSRSTEFVVIIFMVVLGVLLQTKLKRWLPSHEFELPYIGKITIPIALIVALIVYLGIAYLVYSQARVTFDMSYHIAALLFGYWSIAIFRKQLRLAGDGGNGNASH